jgi:hypothetical protein
VKLQLGNGEVLIAMRYDCRFKEESFDPGDLEAFRPLKRAASQLIPISMGFSRGCSGDKDQNGRRGLVLNGYGIGQKRGANRRIA